MVAKRVKRTVRVGGSSRRCHSDQRTEWRPHTFRGHPVDLLRRVVNMGRLRGVVIGCG